MDALELKDVQVNFFLVTFIRKFASKVLAYIMHWMVHDENSPVITVPMQSRSSQLTLCNSRNLCVSLVVLTLRASSEVHGVAGVKMMSVN